MKEDIVKALEYEKKGELFKALQISRSLTRKYKDILIVKQLAARLEENFNVSNKIKTDMLDNFLSSNSADVSNFKRWLLRL